MELIFVPVSRREVPVGSLSEIPLLVVASTM